MASVDEDFVALPLGALADAALQTARDLGADSADVRVQRVRRSVIGLHDTHLAMATDETDLAVAVRVLLDGVGGFACTTELTPDAVALAAGEAVELARVAAALAAVHVDLVPAPVEAGRIWTSSWRQDPFAVARTEQIGLLETWSARLIGAGAVTHVDASLLMRKEQKFYADSAGSSTLQQRILIHPELTVVAVDRDGWVADAMRTLAPPAARGWEYVTEDDGWDWAAELTALPELVAERMTAPAVLPGIYDVIVDPTNLWRTLHETVGHPTEIDRALGHEATLSGGSFASPLRLGDQVIGSELMHVTGDRTAPFGCASVGYDDDGVASSAWDLIDDGVLVGFQVDRATAAAAGEVSSNGCAQAPSATSVPIPRSANVSLAPVDGGPDTDELIAAVERGFYFVGDAGFVIDRHCLRFRSGAQRVYEIVGGEVRGQVRDAAYQATTPDFWTALSAVGGTQTYLLGGTSTCAKGDPAQTAWSSHGAPSALFSGVQVVDLAPRSAG